MNEQLLRDRLGGILLGTALGDALGFIAERMSPAAIVNRFGKVDRFHLLGQHGFVTDDTEQSALMAYALARNPSDARLCVKDLKRALLVWFLCLPFGVGRATLFACLRIAFGLRHTGSNSAGNGTAMRAAIVGGFFFDDFHERVRFGTELAKATHTDPRAVEGALFVAELAAACLLKGENQTLIELFEQALIVVKDERLHASLLQARQLALQPTDIYAAAQILNKEPCAYVVHSLSFCTFAFLKHADSGVLNCLSETIAGGGDADTNGAIVGAWLGALYGESKLPLDLIGKIDDGPFGPTHLRQLADSLMAAKFERQTKTPGYSPLHACLRNLLLVPVILVHFFLRFLPARKR